MTEEATEVKSLPATGRPAGSTPQPPPSLAAEVLTADPFAAFTTPAAETSGVIIEIEHPTTGQVLIEWRVARFGGANNTAIVREERKLKSKLTQGQRRAIDAGSADPDLVARLNRQVFVRVSVLGWRIIDVKLAEQYGEYTHEKADVFFEKYARMYELVSERALDEATFANTTLQDTLGN